MPTFSNIAEAFEFVSMAPYGTHEAVLRLDTGKMLYQSDMGDLDEIATAGDLEGVPSVEIPHKNDLDLGQELVFEFVDKHLPDQSERVWFFFGRPGAYGRFKDLLEDKDLLQAWSDFENARQEQTLRQWCADNDVPLSD